MTIKLEVLSYSDAAFRALCLLLTKDPVYRNIPLGRLADVFRALSLQQVFAAQQDGQLAGALLWTEISAAVATRSIRARELPAPHEFVPHGDAVVVLGVSATSVSVARAVMKGFRDHCRGRVLIYERHLRRAEPIKTFQWFDKSGRLAGADI